MTEPLRIVFAGTPEFAAEHLKALLASPYDIVAVYTQPDRPAGRGQKLMPSPVKQLALEHHIPVLQLPLVAGETRRVLRGIENAGDDILASRAALAGDRERRIEQTFIGRQALQVDLVNLGHAVADASRAQCRVTSERTDRCGRFAGVLRRQRRQEADAQGASRDHRMSEHLRVSLSRDWERRTAARRPKGARHRTRSSRARLGNARDGMDRTAVRDMARRSPRDARPRRTT